MWFHIMNNRVASISLALGFFFRTVEGYNGTLNYVEGQVEPYLCDDTCQPLETSDSLTIGEVCAQVVGGCLEVNLTVVDGFNCTIVETHICNIPTTTYVPEEVKEEHMYVLDIDEIYDYVCWEGEESDEYVVFGHATVQCEESISVQGPSPARRMQAELSGLVYAAYYELSMCCPENTTTTTTTTTSQAPTTTTTTTTSRVCEITAPCPNGTFVTPYPDCGCSDNPCNACPGETICQVEPILFCRDCACGFCSAVDGSPCCDINSAGNNCKTRNEIMGEDLCNLQDYFFPAYTGSGKACSGVEVSLTATLNGCGCQPSQDTECTYNINNAGDDDACFICNTNEVLAAKNDTSLVCASCYGCLDAGCSPSYPCFAAATTLADMQTCIMSEIGDDVCRSNCELACQKN